MTEEKHDIDPWLIPDDEEILLGEPRGEAEQEHYEETGDLLDDEEPEVCPHCGAPYEKEDDGWYIHEMRPVDGDSRDWQPEYDELGRVIGSSSSLRVTPAVWCSPSGKMQTDNSQPWGYKDF